MLHGVFQCGCEILTGSARFEVSRINGQQIEEHETGCNQPALSSAIAKKIKPCTQQAQSFVQPLRQVPSEPSEFRLGVAQEVLAQEICVAVITESIDQGQLRDENNIGNRTRIVQSVEPFGFGYHFETPGIHLAHAVVEDRLHQAFSRSEMILDGMVVLLSGVGGNSPEGYGVDSFARKQHFGSENHFCSTVEFMIQH